jgi:dolichol-phosphate mannosyltransferase
MTNKDRNDELVSVVIPAYNEGETLTANVANLLCALRGAGVHSELVIVNDGSSDDTGAVIEALIGAYPEVKGVFNAPMHGYGYAVRRGIENASGGVIAIVMADGSDNPADLLRYLELIQQGHDCAFGSRFGGNAKVENYPRSKMVVNRLGNYIMAKLAKSEYDDFTNGFKAYRREVVDLMQPLHSGQFNLTVEMSMKAVLSGARFAVTANDWKQREAGTSSFNVVKQSLLYLVTIHWVLTGYTRFMRLIEKAARVDSA